MADFQDRIARLSPKRLALLATQLQQRLEKAEHRAEEPIAVIGLGCRLPGGANGPEAYWKLLSDGVDAITDVPADRWDVDAFYDPDPDASGRMVTRGGGFIDDIDLFDAAFFGITPREAVSLDPRHRILLEVAWQALEHAGQAPDRLLGSATGVFVGACGSEYSQRLLEDQPDMLNAYLVSGVASSMAAGRISYLLGLQGPALCVDTACSASLVAVHLACQSLRMGECDMALAAGSTLILNPEISIGLSSAGMLSPDSRCRTFDARADGIVRGEGFGVVVLKRLSDAEADGDPVMAVIRGTAINQDGRSSGVTAPHGPAQEAVIADALRRSGMAPTEVDYVETHGTGTTLGDPIEVRALGATLCEGRSKTSPLRIGSVKTNFGHLEASAGIAGLIKVILALGHRQIPPHLHFQQPNSHIDWDNLPIEVTTRLTDWPGGERRRVAGVSSFGFSGTNAHVIVQEAPKRRRVEAERDRPVHVLTYSAKSEYSLSALTKGFEQALSTGEASAADICFTANVGRAHFRYRAAVVGNSRQQLRSGLEKLRTGDTEPDAVAGERAGGDAPKIAFLFTGQGSQYPGMGRELFNTCPRFRDTMQRCEEILKPLLDEPLLSVLYPASQSDSPLINQTAYTQPALFALEYALADLWASWGVVPSVVLGHSLGEYVAACVAGVFTLEEGLTLVARRARLMQELPKIGAMAAVFADEALVVETLAPHGDSVSVAAVNGPENTVISGAAKVVQVVLRDFEARGIAFHSLKVSHAFHSKLMEPMLEPLERALSETRFSKPRLGLVSNLTGRLSDPEELLRPGRWLEHTRQAVRFSDSVRFLHEEGYPVFVEVGPNPVLLGMGREVLAESEAAWLPSLRQGEGNWTQMLRSLVRLYVAGTDIDFREFERDRPRRKVALPTYPFERQRYWVEGSPGAARPGPQGRRETWRNWLYELKWRPHPSPGGAVSTPSFLSAPSTIAEMVHPQIAPLATLHGVGVYEEFAPGLDALCTAYILRALGQLGWDLRSESDVVTAEDIQQRLAVLPRHFRLVGRMLEILTEDGILRHAGPDWLVSEVPAPVDPEAMVTALQADFPDCSAELSLVQACGGSLSEVLIGRTDPMQLLFPDGSLAPTEELYQEAPGLRMFNSLVRDAVSAALAKLPVGRTIRILEIGAGTGAASSYVLPTLPTDQTEYTFTDVSRVFLDAARQKFRDYPFVEYRLLDAGLDPEQQGFSAHSFDIVLAANVLHATADLRQTLAHVNQLLAPEGLLVLLEGTAPQRFGDLTVGLTPGWWSFSDVDLRPSYALLSAGQWQSLLTEMGYSEVAAVLGETDSSDKVLSRQAVLLARRPAVDADAVAPRDPGNWLVLCDDGGLGEHVAGIIREQGGRCVTAVKGTSFEQSAPETYSLDPTSADDLTRLLESVQSAGYRTLHGVAHLWALDEAMGAGANLDAVRASMERGCGSALYLVQALAASRIGAGARLVLVTSGGQPVETDLEELNLAHSPLWGLGRVVRLEHPELDCVNIDVVMDATPESARQLLEQVLVREDGEHQLALRDGRQFVLRVASSAAAELPEQSEPVLDSEASYLITGGLGGLGLLIAGWLVRRGARKLILLGRSAPSAESAAEIAAMERSGARVRIEQVDVSDCGDLQAVLNTLKAEGGELRGVVHSAGLLDDGGLLQQSWDRFQRVMASKVDGSWNLHQITRTMPLDFFVLFSSGASFLGSAGQSNHAAANAFMDALAHHRRAIGLPSLTINWGPWAYTGAAVRTGVIAQAVDQGFTSIAPDQGLRVLEHLIGAGSTQVGVLPVDRDELIARAQNAGAEHLYDELRSARDDGAKTITQQRRAPPRRDLLDRLAEASAGRRSALVLEAVQSETAVIMGLEDPGTIDPGQPLTDLGLDSLMAVELRNAIGDLVGKSLPATLLFNYPSLEELTSHLIDDVLALSVATRAEAPAQAAEQENDDARQIELEELSEDEVADLLAEKLLDLEDPAGRPEDGG